LRRLPQETPLVAFGVGALAIGMWFWARAEPTVTRTVAFDNTYGSTKTLVVYVKVDQEAEQRLVAACDEKTCKFTLPLQNGRHQLSVAVEQLGQRGRATTVTLDTTNLPPPPDK